MKNTILLILLLSSILVTAAEAENLLPHARIEGFTSAAGGEDGVRALYDGKLNIPWTNSMMQGLPYQFVFSWDAPVIIGGIRVAVPGGSDTSVCARDLRVEILPEGHINFWEARHIRIQPHEGYQSFLLPALPTRTVRLTVLQNYGHSVNTYISELELLNPLDAGHRESMPGWVNYSSGEVWLHNGLTDTVAAPLVRESLSDVFGLVTGDGGEATLLLTDNPSPFSEGKGLIMQVGGFSSCLADRYYDGRPKYRFLLTGGDFTVYTLDEEAEAEFYTREGVFRLTGTGSVVIKTAPTWGTSIMVREGNLSILDRRLDGFPALDLRGGEMAVLPARPTQTIETAMVQPEGLVAWFSPVAAVAAVGSEIKWLRQARNLALTDWRYSTLPPALRRAVKAGNDPDTLPAKVGRVIALAADYEAARGEPVTLAAHLQQSRQLAELLLYGLTPWKRLPLSDDVQSLAAAWQQADLRCGFITTAGSLQPHGENRSLTRLVEESSSTWPVVDFSGGAVRTLKGKIIGLTAENEFIIWQNGGIEYE